MKINTVDTVIQDFREGQNIFRRPSVELMVREISRQAKRIEELEIKQHIHWDANMMLTMADNFKGYIDLIIELQTKLKEMEARLDLHQTNRRLLNRNLGFAHDRIAELEQERRWIPVSERLPEVKEDDSIPVDFIVKYVHKSIVSTGTFIDSEFYELDNWDKSETENVTHWKYRPQPPESEEE